MCTLIDTIRQEGENKGRIEERVSLLIDLLKERFDPLSQEIVIEIENRNFEQLDSLKTHFFKLKNQNVIIMILSSTKNT